MNRIITIFVAIIYLAVSSGIVVNTHFCMGEIAGVSYKANPDDHCGKCGMKNSGCCHDDIKFIKLQDSQQSAAFTNYQLPILDPVFQQQSSADYLLPVFSQATIITNNSPPKVAGPAINVLHCVFRI